MVTELRVSRQRGGNRHPLSVRGFIIAHLTMFGEDYIANIHRAYKLALDQMAIENGRLKQNSDGRLMGKRYHKPVYHSFEMALWRLAQEGAIEFSGREEESDNPQFVNWPSPPVRRYYRLATGAGIVTDHRNGH